MAKVKVSSQEDFLQKIKKGDRVSHKGFIRYDIYTYDGKILKNKFGNEYTLKQFVKRYPNDFNKEGFYIIK